MVVEVVGLHYRRREVEAFVREAYAADLKGTRYGVRLDPEPENPHDPNAIKVVGETAMGGKWHIGYLSRDVADDITRDLTTAGVPIAAELYNIYVSKGGFIEVKLIVLAPPGNGEKARLKRREKAVAS